MQKGHWFILITCPVGWTFVHILRMKGGRENKRKILQKSSNHPFIYVHNLLHVLALRNGQQQIYSLITNIA